MAPKSDTYHLLQRPGIDLSIDESVAELRQTIEAMERRTGMTRGEAVDFTANLVGRRRSTIYMWLSATEDNGINTCPPHILDWLRLREYCVRNPLPDSIKTILSC